MPSTSMGQVKRGRGSGASGPGAPGPVGDGAVVPACARHAVHACSVIPSPEDHDEPGEPAITTSPGIIVFVMISGMVTDLTRVARETDEATRRARARLVTAVREASAAGQSQAEIARQIGRSQPEVSRLLHFHGTAPLARRLRRHRRQVIAAVQDAGGSDVRVFGSVATGRERVDSDVDLLFHMGRPLGLTDLAMLEERLGEILGVPVDLVPDTNIRPVMRERILSEAVPL